MKLDFILSNLNAIVLALRFILLIIVAIRFFRPNWLGNISYIKLILITVGFNLFYGLFITWGQYHVWATSSDISRTLLDSPLPTQVPFPAYLEWVRPFFENHFGYFLYYVLGRFWLYISILFLFSGIFYWGFRTWKFYRGGFQYRGPELILILMLICGWPAAPVCIALGFVLSILLSIFSYMRGQAELKIEPVFIFSAFCSLLFADVILSHLMIVL